MIAIKRISWIAISVLANVKWMTYWTWTLDSNSLMDFHWFDVWNWHTLSISFVYFYQQIASEAHQNGSNACNCALCTNMAIIGIERIIELCAHPCVLYTLCVCVCQLWHVIECAKSSESHSCFSTQPFAHVYSIFPCVYVFFFRFVLILSIIIRDDAAHWTISDINKSHFSNWSFHS